MLAYKTKFYYRFLIENHAFPIYFGRLFFAASAIATPMPEDVSNNQCEQVWITAGVEMSGSSASVAATSTTQDATASRTSAPSTLHATQDGSPSQLPDDTTATSNKSHTTNDAPVGYWTQMPDRPDGTPGFLIESNSHKAPRTTEPVPNGAAIFTPEDGKTLDCAALADWITHQHDEVKLASKYLKIAPGTYRYKPGPQMAPGTDPNTVKGENIVLYLLKGGWTFDFHDVTFLIDFIPELTNQRPSVMIYCLQSDDLTVYDGNDLDRPRRAMESSPRDGADLGWKSHLRSPERLQRQRVEGCRPPKPRLHR